MVSVSTNVEAGIGFVGGVVDAAILGSEFGTWAGIGALAIGCMLMLLAGIRANSQGGIV